MKIILIIAGVILLCLLMIGGGVIGYRVHDRNVLERSGKAYVDEAIPAIVTTWVPDQLLKRESPSFLKATSDAQLVSLFVAFRRLGPLKTYKGCTGEATITETPGSGKNVTATYLAKAAFKNGDAEIKVFLVQLDGKWKIQGFRVDSPLFNQIKVS